MPKKSKTHCKNGHELTDDNVLVRGDNRRMCRTCHNADSKRSAAKKQQEKILGLSAAPVTLRKHRQPDPHSFL